MFAESYISLLKRSHKGHQTEQFNGVGGHCKAIYCFVTCVQYLYMTSTVSALMCAVVYKIHLHL